MRPRLEVDGVTVSYEGTVSEVENASLTLREGEILVVLGPNGAGKSTLLRAISGLVTPLRGSIRLDGDEVNTLPPFVRVRRGLVLLAEARHGFGTLTVEENLLLSIHREAGRGKGAELSALYDRYPILGERRQQLASRLSGGERQILALARAEALRPKVMMLDEPSLGLAPRMLDFVFPAIRQVAEAGVCVLLVEQNVERSVGIADRAAVMSAGHLSEARSPGGLTQEHLRAAYFGAAG